MRVNTRKIGTEKESLACDYLVNNGYKVVERNFHAGRFAEVDIIAESGDGYLCFVEVKFRTDDEHGGYTGAVDDKKIKNICRGADYYIRRNRIPDDTPMRFDIVYILGDEVSLVQDAFEYVR
ncbi:MAG: YraN family protein [Eubacterium sp.]|nr:YraN family protein [Eubacterium sp.]